MMKRVISILLLISMVMTILVSCGDNGSGDGKTVTDGGAANDTGTTPDAAAEIPYIDTLPDIDYGGRKFTMGAPASYNLAPEELTGETINDAAYYQMLNVQDKFNIEIEVLDIGQTQVAASVKAGDNAYQAINGMTFNFASSFIVSGLVQNLYKFDRIDFTQPWWNQNTVKDLRSTANFTWRTATFAPSAASRTFTRSSSTKIWRLISTSTRTRYISSCTTANGQSTSLRST